MRLIQLLLTLFIGLIFISYTISYKINPIEVYEGKPAPAKQTSSYSTLVYTGQETLKASAGTKSVLFNSAGTKLYAMNLEGLSVYEFNRINRSLNRQFIFKAHKGKGWDYQAKTPIISWQEKPVEACFSHQDKILWVSLHNAGGIVPIKVDEDMHCPAMYDTSFTKSITVKSKDGSSYKIETPLIKTGATPKVVAMVNNNNNLLVSNWHSKTVSILNINQTNFPFGTVTKNITTESIPRGICIDEKNGKSYIAIMGSNSIAVVNNKTWVLEKYIKVMSNPRHIVLGDDNKMYVSFNSLNSIACIDVVTGNTLFTSPTHQNPRSIAISKNKKFLLVTCYNGNTIDVVEIMPDRFNTLYSLACPGKPVGIDIYEDDHHLEAWVCNYVGGNIKVFSFSKQ